MLNEKNNCSQSKKGVGGNMKENITDKEKKEIEEMTNELVAIVPMVKPKEDSYTDYCKQIATALRNVGYRKQLLKEFEDKKKKILRARTNLVNK